MFPTIHTTEVNSDIRVALIIQHGKLKPVWFELLGMPSAERVHVKELCYTWSYYNGAAKILNFSVSDGSNTYRLSLNTLDFTWRLGIAGE